MNKLNLPPFYVGQKVEYISGVNMPKGTKGNVLDIKIADCGCYLIRFSKKDSVPTVGIFLICACCGGKLSESGAPYWMSTSFRAIEESKPPLLTFQQIKEVEKEEVLILN